MCTVKIAPLEIMVPLWQDKRRLEHVQCGLMSGADKFDTTLCHSDFEGLAMAVLVKTPLLTALHV